MERYTDVFLHQNFLDQFSTQITPFLCSPKKKLQQILQHILHPTLHQILHHILHQTLHQVLHQILHQTLHQILHQILHQKNGCKKKEKRVKKVHPKKSFARLKNSEVAKMTVRQLCATNFFDFPASFPYIRGQIVKFK